MLAAEQRRHVAWGESNERQRGGWDPRVRNTRKAFPAAIWRRRRQIAAGKNGFARMTWGYGLLARSSQSSPQASIFNCSAVVLRSDPSQHRCAGLSSHASKSRCVPDPLSRMLSKFWPTIYSAASGCSGPASNPSDSNADAMSSGVARKRIPVVRSM